MEKIREMKKRKTTSEMKKKKPLVALLTNNDDDIYCFRKEVIETLIDEGYQILISCPYGEKFELMADMEFLYDDLFIDRRGTNIIVDFKLFLHYLKIFVKYKPAVVLAYTAKPNVYGSIAAHLLRIPVINNITGFGSVINESGWKKQFIMALFKLAYRRSACVMLQNSTNLKMAVRNRMVKGKRMLIPGSGVNTSRYPLQPYPDGGNGKEGETVIFNYMGRILHDKGVDDYIEAARRIKENYPRTEFNMLGFIEPTENHYEKELKELEAQGIVRYLGNHKDVKPFIARSHALIHPSIYGEGMSNALLENASSGRPVITTNNPGCRETLKDHVTGYIYQGGNVEELVEKIEMFLKLDNESRKIMGEKGRKRAIRHFSRDIVVDAYLDAIREIVK